MFPLQSFSSGVLAEVVRRQPSSPERTNFAWQIAVGPTLARVTRVELVEGTLIVRAADPRWLDEIARARDIILLKMQHLLGRGEPGIITCEKA